MNIAPDALMSQLNVVAFNVIPWPYPQYINKKISILVEEILRNISNNKNLDTTFLEAEIDQYVYGLYGLTEEEIAIVESS